MVKHHPEMANLMASQNMICWCQSTGMKERLHETFTHQANAADMSSFNNSGTYILDIFDPPEDWASCEPLHDCFLANFPATASGVCYLAPLLLECLTDFGLLLGESCVLTGLQNDIHSRFVTNHWKLPNSFVHNLHKTNMETIGTLSHGNLRWDNL